MHIPINCVGVIIRIIIFRYALHFEHTRTHTHSDDAYTATRLKALLFRFFDQQSIGSLPNNFLPLNNSVFYSILLMICVSFFFSSIQFDFLLHIYFIVATIHRPSLFDSLLPRKFTLKIKTKDNTFIKFYIL